MKFLSLCLLSLSLVAFVSAQEDHKHESCACASEENNFVIDCSDQQAMLDSVAVLAANGCEADCENAICLKNFFMIQAHHDYCLEDEVPEPVEDALHIYEDNCDACEILKKVDPALEKCPDHSCTDGSGSNAYTTMIMNGCLNDCSSALCSSSYKTLKAVHDLCEEDTLSEEAELGFHDLEEACEAENCNVGDAALEMEQLICTEDHEDGDGGSGGGLAGLCFSGSSTVLAEDGTSIAMKDLKIGDRVQSSNDGKFESVYSFGHYEPNAMAEYLRIQSQKGAIEISGPHMLFLDNNKAVPALSVRVGDMLLGGDAVTKIDQVMRKGAFAPFTNSGTIVVDKIVASNYVTLSGRTTFLGVDMHLVAHMGVAPRRLMCQLGMCSTNEQYTAEGVATWIPFKFASFVAAQEAAIAFLVAAAVVAVSVRRQKSL